MKAAALATSLHKMNPSASNAVRRHPYLLPLPPGEGVYVCLPGPAVVDTIVHRTGGQRFANSFVEQARAPLTSPIRKGHAQWPHDDQGVGGLLK